MFFLSMMMSPSKLFHVLNLIILQIPSMLLYLIGNIITQYLCISAVFVLTTGILLEPFLHIISPKLNLDHNKKIVML